MVLFINRILYSLYCFENRLSFLFLWLFKPILFAFSKMAYMCNSHGNKKHKRFACFRKEADDFLIM